MAFIQGPVTLTVGQSTTAEIIGFDQHGAEMALPEGTTVTFSIDQDSIATSAPNDDKATDAIAAVAAGVANLTATVQGPNGPISDTETITVAAEPSVLSSIKIAFNE